MSGSSGHFPPAPTGSRLWLLSSWARPQCGLGTKPGANIPLAAIKPYVFDKMHSDTKLNPPNYKSGGSIYLIAIPQQYELAGQTSPA